MAMTGTKQFLEIGIEGDPPMPHKMTVHVNGEAIVHHVIGFDINVTAGQMPSLTLRREAGFDDEGNRIVLLESYEILTWSPLTALRVSD